jgi:hypothetical protein
MNAIQSAAFLGAFLLLFVVSTSALSFYSKMAGDNGRTEETRRSREGSWLIILNFLLILLILVWRVL